MKRAIVIGCPGSGKSTFARKLSERASLPLYHLDMLYWNSDRTVVEKSVFFERLEKVLENEEWIIDGNYASTMEKRIKACDTVFFLDYPTRVCLEGIMARCGKKRPDMPWVESSPDEEFIDFVKKYETESRPKVMALLNKYWEKDAVIFTSREEAERFLKSAF